MSTTTMLEEINLAADSSRLSLDDILEAEFVESRTRTGSFRDRLKLGRKFIPDDTAILKSLSVQEVPDRPIGDLIVDRTQAETDLAHAVTLEDFLRCIPVFSRARLNWVDAFQQKKVFLFEEVVRSVLGLGDNALTNAESFAAIRNTAMLVQLLKLLPDEDHELLAQDEDRVRETLLAVIQSREIHRGELLAVLSVSKDALRQAVLNQCLSYSMYTEGLGSLTEPTEEGLESLLAVTPDARKIEVIQHSMKLADRRGSIFQSGDEIARVFELIPSDARADFLSDLLHEKRTQEVLSRDSELLMTLFQRLPDHRKAIVFNQFVQCPFFTTEQFFSGVKQLSLSARKVIFPRLLNSNTLFTRFIKTVESFNRLCDDVIEKPELVRLIKGMKGVDVPKMFSELLQVSADIHCLTPGNSTSDDNLMSFFGKTKRKKKAKKRVVDRPGINVTLGETVPK